MAYSDFSLRSQLLLVFDNEKESYERFIQNITQQNIKDFAEIDVSFEDQQHRRKLVSMGHISLRW
jgi:hypothetical protein